MLKEDCKINMKVEDAETGGLVVGVDALVKRQHRNKYANFDIKPGQDEEVMTNKGIARYSYGEFYKLFRVYGVDWWEPKSV